MALKLAGLKNFMYKYVSGGMSIKIGRRKYINYPKTANFMVPGIILSGLFQTNAMNNPNLFALGTALVLIGFVSFFYPMIAPLNWSELDDEGKIWVVQTYGIGAISNTQRSEYFDIVDDMTDLEKKAYNISEGDK